MKSSTVKKPSKQEWLQWQKKVIREEMKQK